MIICYTIIIIYIILLVVVVVVVVVHAEEKEMRVPTSPCTSIYVKVFPSILFFFASSRPDPERSFFSDILLLLLLCDPSEVPSRATGLDSRWKSYYAYIMYIYKCMCVCVCTPCSRAKSSRHRDQTTSRLPSTAAQQYCNNVHLRTRLLLPLTEIYVNSASLYLYNNMILYYIQTRYNIITRHQHFIINVV